MAFTYTPGGSDRDTVRLLIGDTNTGDANAQIFQDAEIDVFLSLEGSNVRRAAAQACDSMAASEVMVLKVIRIGDLSTDGAAVARELRQRAKELREQADNGSGDYTGMVDWAEQVPNDFAYRERIYNQALREGV